MDKNYLKVALKLYSICALLLIIFLGVYFLETEKEITLVIGKTTVMIFFDILFYLNLGFYLFSLIRTIKIFYFTIPYLASLTFLLLNYWFVGTMVITDKFL
ncbi:MAG: hypothetical protein ED557_12045 [Balneola sp.]|nr:MAG: hypothetical protein ED557_12045 [Balneola sp.]